MRHVLTIRAARPEETGQLAALAAATFPLACPPDLDNEDIEAFIAEKLSTANFSHFIASPATVVLVADRDDFIVGYSLLDLSEPPSTVRAMLGTGRAIEVGKFFLAASEHGQGTGVDLMRSVKRYAQEDGAKWLWLGVSRQNHRANRFYEKHGFHCVGTRPFAVGRSIFPNDYVLAASTTAGTQPS